MCFGSGGEQVIRTTKLDPKSQAFKDKTLDIADELGTRPYQSYGGQRIAEFTPDQQSAINAVRNSQGLFVSQLGGASKSASAVGNRRAPMIGGSSQAPVPLDRAAATQRGGNIGDGYTLGGDRALPAGSAGGGTFNVGGADMPVGMKGLFDHLMQNGGGNAPIMLPGGDPMMTQSPSPGRPGFLDMMPGPDGVWSAAQPVAAATTVNPTDLERVGAGTLLDAPIDAYMNRYTQEALDPALAEIRRQAAIQKTGNNARASAAGAYGGSRSALMNTETDRNALDMIARTESEGMARAFDTAAGLVSKDQDRTLTADVTNAGASNTQRARNMDALNEIAKFNAGLKQQTNLANQQTDLSQQGLNLQGADLQGKLAKLGQDMNFADIAAAMGIGQQQQAQDQKNLDLGYQDFLTEQNYPLQMLNMRTSTLSGQPYTGSVYGPGPSGAAQGLGLLSLLLGGGKSLGFL